MGWFSKLPATVTPLETKEQKFLEDLPPKFEDAPPAEQPKSPYGDALSRVKISDIKPSTYLAMPCFREAMMTGFQAMGVLGGVMFLVHKKPGKALNWGVMGFFLGNIIGWEQCHSIRRKSFETMERARQANKEKNDKKWEEKSSEKDERLEKWKQVQEYYDKKK